MWLEKIKSPKELKELSLSQLHEVVNEAHDALLFKTSTKGGHNGPNFGVIELTVALHYVFDTPKDKLVFDISHQSYVHKMLTGRAQAFLEKEHFDDVSGYTNPKESEYDLFTIGHTSTSLSLASGIAHARKLKGEDYNVLAVIGDGSMSGGMAFEALNTIATLKENIIIIVNDNEQSIAPNPTGGIYEALRALRATNGKAKHNFFESLGLKYHYLEEGNDLEKLIALLEKVKDTDEPVVLHIHTRKGHDLSYMMKNREAYHYGGPYNPQTGEYLKGTSDETYNSITTKFMLEKMEKDKKIVVVNAGTPMMIFTPEQRVMLKEQFVDVGIAEQQAATMAAGLAKNGAKPIWCVTSTFMQRSFDQLSHDIALNNLPVTVLVYGASIYGMNDESHLGFFDIPFISHIPNFTYLTPTSKEEYLQMLDWSVEQNEGPVAIRVPVGPIHHQTSNVCNFKKLACIEKGNDVAVISVSNFFKIADEVVKTLQQQGVQPSYYRTTNVTTLDTETLCQLKSNHKVVLVLEDGLKEGGYGQGIATYYGDSDVKVKVYGIDKKFHDRFNVSKLLEQLGISANQIIHDVQILRGAQ